jgi:primary-amine oxidase
MRSSRSFPAALCAALATALTAPATGAADRGPLDPLDGAEIATAVTVIEASNRFPHGAFFPTVVLKEPPKGEVLAWSPGRPFRREAFANVYDRDSNTLFEAVVDLRDRRLVSFVERPDRQPPVHDSDYTDADKVVRADPRWRRAMRDRGIAPDDVFLDIWAPGEIGLPPAEHNTRFLRALSFFEGDLPNPYDRPIEGVLVTVDMNRLRVADFVDTGARPVDTTITGNASTRRTGLKPLVVTQPDGPSFHLDGAAVRWQGWRFRIGFNQREGLVLHEIGYERGDAVRPIIHRLALDEIYVPYAIPDPNWAWRAALDVGEYNVGQYSEPLEKDVDVPENAVFVDEFTPSDVGTADGEPAFELPHAVALYERDAGSLWDRTDPTTFERDARFARELVVTNAYSNGNYTYNIEYVFRLDGGIDVVAGATSTTLNRGVATAADGSAFSTLVTPNIAAPMHQHFFNFRIDFDVDGTSNRVVERNFQSVPSGSGNAFSAIESVLTREGFRDHAPDRAWSVESTTEDNAVGHHTGFELVPGNVTRPYSQATYPPLQQAPFAQHGLWVTRYRDGELSAVGDYPNQGPAGEGLTRYVSDNADVNGRDLVVWYTAGFTHEPHVEDYPVMPVERIGFSLRPAGFFDQNPALDVP